MESVETFKFLEFNENAAQSLWRHYCQMMHVFSDRFDVPKIAKHHVQNVPGKAVEGRDDWMSQMERIGLTGNFQEELLTPEAAEMRVMGSVKEWASR